MSSLTCLCCRSLCCLRDPFFFPGDLPRAAAAGADVEGEGEARAERGKSPSSSSSSSSEELRRLFLGWRAEVRLGGCSVMPPSAAQSEYSVDSLGIKRGEYGMYFGCVQKTMLMEVCILNIFLINHLEYGIFPKCFSSGYGINFFLVWKQTLEKGSFHRHYTSLNVLMF